MRNWLSETERYRDRVSVLDKMLNDLADEVQKFPRAPLPVALSDDAALKYEICILIIGIFRSTQQLINSFYATWLMGQYLTASLIARLLIEHQGVLGYTSERVLKKYEQTRDVAVCQGRMSRLLLGSKSGIPTPGRDVNIKYDPINVMEFVRQAERDRPGTIDDYNFLCDASHPSYLQHSYLVFAGPTYDNWQNDRFVEYAHATIERTLTIVEFAVMAIALDGIQMIRNCLPSITAEIPD